MIFFLIFAADSRAKMYKCVASDGKVVYQTHKCESDEKSELISDKEFGVDYTSNENKYGNIDKSYQAPDFRKVQKISNGEKVNLGKFAVNGVKTAFYFYADWCGSCKRVGPEVEKIVNESDNLALRKIDLTRADSPAKTQYKVNSVPYFIVFDESGREISRGNRFSY